MVDTKQVMNDALKWVKENRVFSAITALFILTQLFLILSIWQKPLVWDSGVYVAIGKYIYSLGEYGFWSAHTAPGVPLLIGLFWKLGVPVMGYSRIIWMLVSATGLLIFYTLTDRMFGRREAIATAGIIAASHTYFFFTPEVLSDIPSAILVFASLYMVTRERYVSGGALAATAFLFRYPAALVGPAAVIFMVAVGIRDKKFRAMLVNIFKFSAAVVAVVIPYLVALYFLNGEIIGTLMSSASATASTGAATTSWGLLTSLTYYLVEAVWSNPLTLFLPVGLYVVLHERDWNYGGFLSGLVVFYTFFSLFPLQIERYMMPFLPLIALFSARGVVEAWDRLDIERVNLNHVVAGATIIILLSSFLAVYSAYNWEQPGRISFLENASSLDGEIATNDPSVNLYSDFRYHPLPPSELPWILEQDADRISHWAINDCNWDCRGNEECEENVEEFEDELENRYEKTFELEENSCNYSVYSK